MQQGGKGHKGKGLTVSIGNIMPQVLRLERDTCRRTEGETILEAGNLEEPRLWPPHARRGGLEPQGVHLRPFKVHVLPRIPKAVIEPPCLLRQRPNQAFSCRHNLRLAVKYGVLKGKRS